MKKWIGFLLSVLFTIVLISVTDPFHFFKPIISGERKVEEPRIILTQGEAKEGKKEESDSYFILVLKQLQEAMDGWLKSLNEQIEREDITRFKVRFLEILRNILEWVKEKVDATIESSTGKKQEEKEGERPFHKTRLNTFSLALKG
jgi:hypothetical protein